MCEFGILILGEVGKFHPSRFVPREGSARQNLSPTCEYYLGMVMRAVRA